MDAVAKEIAELHQFFQDYFRGLLAAEAIMRFTDTLGEGFTLIDSAGRITEREAIISAIRRAHGTRSDIKIWTEKPVLRHQDGALWVATYEEWQTAAGQTTQRQSTVVFGRDASAPNGLVWLHVHESGLLTRSD